MNKTKLIIRITLLTKYNYDKNSKKIQYDSKRTKKYNVKMNLQIPPSKLTRAFKT